MIFRLRRSRDFHLRALIVFDSVLTATSRQVGPLTLATTYYWHVRSRNSNGVSPWSSPWTFSNAPFYADHYTLNDTISFPFHASVCGIHCTGLSVDRVARRQQVITQHFDPGHVRNELAGILGQRRLSRAFLVPFAEGDARFTFAAGRGFWLIKMGPWILTSQASSHGASSALDDGGSCEGSQWVEYYHQPL